jgi:mutator protein MutT
MPATVVCIGAIVKKDARILLVRQAAGHSLAGQWTIPWGRLEAGESAAVAALRETREEAGIVARVSGFLGVQELPHPWTGWLALVYRCEHVSGEPRPDGRETDAARYFCANELAQLEEPIEPWSAWLVRRAFAGKIAPIARSETSNPFHPSPAFL